MSKFQQVFPTQQTAISRIPDSRGMTLRQHFAGLALQGLLSCDPQDRLAFVATAREAVKYADALIDELDKN